jgi:hypothetical protein
MPNELTEDPFFTQLCEGYTDSEIQDAKQMKRCISDLFAQMTTDYQQTRAERREVTAAFPPSDEAFSVIEELELLTSDLRGYASQLQVRDSIENPAAAIDSPEEQLSRRKRRLIDRRNFVGCVGFHSSTQPTDPCTELISAKFLRRGYANDYKPCGYSVFLASPTSILSIVGTIQSSKNTCGSSIIFVYFY